MKRLLIATDAWHPQINGVVRSIEAMVREAPRQGFSVDVLSPQGFMTLPMPGYDEIALAISPFLRPRSLSPRIEALKPDFIHIATEGPIGRATRNWCLRKDRPFTTSYHTKFPEYVRARVPVPVSATYAMLRRFHNAGSGVMVATDTLEAELKGRGFRNILRWGRGVDSALYHPRETSVLDLPRPIWLFVGRVAVEKNLPAFLDLDLPGTKVIVGGGPDLDMLKAKYPDTVFTGPRVGVALAEHYASADVFVFPSLTDTFGMVLLEAMASGVPVAAYPVTGPRDVVKPGVSGVLDQDLKTACLGALQLPKGPVLAEGRTHSWEASAAEFFHHVSTALTPPSIAKAKPQPKVS